jgi:hypothetical protein
MDRVGLAVLPGIGEEVQWNCTNSFSSSDARSSLASRFTCRRANLHRNVGSSVPLPVDVFVAMGELAVFVALAQRRHSQSHRRLAVTSVGLAVSGPGDHWPRRQPRINSKVYRGCAALAAAAALAVGVGGLKRVAAG